jgi:hypothetical protein
MYSMKVVEVVNSEAAFDEVFIASLLKENPGTGP